MEQNDLISRKALLERLEPEYKDTVRLIQNGETHLDSLAEGFTEVHNLIRAAPAVEAEPMRHGRWLPPVIGVYGCTCSVCKMQSDNDFKYCPNCGAKMDLQEE